MLIDLHIDGVQRYLQRHGLTTPRALPNLNPLLHPSSLLFLRPEMLSEMDLYPVAGQDTVRLSDALRQVEVVPTAMSRHPGEDADIQGPDSTSLRHNPIPHLKKTPNAYINFKEAIPKNEDRVFLNQMIQGLVQKRND